MDGLTEEDAHDGAKWLLLHLFIHFGELITCVLIEQFAGLSSFPGLGVAQGLSNPMPFGQSFHSTGAFQPKVVIDTFVFLLNSFFARVQILNFVSK